jgi:hypothetical protein
MLKGCHVTSHPKTSCCMLQFVLASASEYNGT